MSVEIRVRESEYRLFMRNLDRIRGEVRVGVPDTDHGDGRTCDEIAKAHEFGLGVPERSFLRSWCDQYLPAHLKKLLTLTREVAKNRLSTGWQDPAGKHFVAGVRAQIKTNIPPPLAAATVARKGQDLALVDTGVLFESIIYEVV